MNDFEEQHDAWAIARENFETDDGSLPGIEFSNLRASEVHAILTFFHTNGIAESSSPAALGMSRLAESSVEVAARRLKEEDFVSNHCCYSGITFASQQLPTLGLFVDPNSIEIDYRMGPEWNREAVNALFELIAHLQSFCTACVVGSATVEPLPCPASFARALQMAVGDKH